MQGVGRGFGLEEGGDEAWVAPCGLFSCCVDVVASSNGKGRNILQESALFH